MLKFLRENNAGRQIVGFKLLKDHLHPEQHSLLLSLGLPLHLIILQRDNHLAQYVSMKKASRSKSWVLNNTDKIEFSLNEEQFRMWRAKNTEWFRKVKYSTAALKKRGATVTHLTYEKDLSDANKLHKTMRRITDILKIPPLAKFDETEYLSKQSTQTLRTKIKNWNDIDASLRKQYGSR